MTGQCKYPEREQFAKNLRAAIEKSGMRQIDLAKHAALSIHRIHSFLNVTVMVKNYAEIKRMAKALGVSPDDLLTLEAFQKHHERVLETRQEAAVKRVNTKLKIKRQAKPKLNLAELDNPNNYLERAKQQIAHRIKAMRLCEKPKGALDLLIVLGRF